VFGAGERAVALVHPRDDLVAEVRVVPAGPRRVEELAAAERRPAVDVDEDGRRCVAGGEQVVGELGEVLAEWSTVLPHVQLAGQALDDVDGGVAALGVVVVPWREVDA
jgi:hypothetical protein